MTSAETIATDFLENHKYDRLIKGIEKETALSFPHCLLNINHSYSYEAPEHNVNCICGHKNLTNVHVFTTQDNKEFNVGNICITNILDNIRKDDTDLMKRVVQHLCDIQQSVDHQNKLIKERKQKEKNHHCLRCKLQCIKSNYEYKNEIRKHFCGDCITGSKVKCLLCPKLVPFEKDYKGCYKLLCYGCWLANKPTSIFKQLRK